MKEVLGEWKLFLVIGIIENKKQGELIYHYMIWIDQERYGKIFNG